MKSRRFWITCALGLVMAFGVAPSATAIVHPPDVDPHDFICAGVTNEFFPLVPGTTWTYTGESEGVSTSDVVEVTSCTRVIEGVTTTVVHDTAYENGVKVEETFDYFAIACDGTVWYCGEDSTEFDPVTGLPISTEGSWIAGQNDADAGFIMLANPQVGNRYLQEFAPGVAVDQAKVASLDGSACSPYTDCIDNLLVTKETSQLDPGVVENKFYTSGIGFIRSEIIKGGDEHSELVSFTMVPATCPPPPPAP
jgi:hypothetical protein